MADERTQWDREVGHWLGFFTHAHLPEHLAAVSRPFCELAHRMVETLPVNPSLVKALEHLMEAKDAAVRALLAPK